MYGTTELHTMERSGVGTAEECGQCLPYLSER
jgi:hypothetical protein